MALGSRPRHGPGREQRFVVRVRVQERDGCHTEIILEIASRSGTRRAEEPPTAFEKVSLTIAADVLHGVRDRVEPGKVSAYATLALRRQLEARRSR